MREPGWWKKAVFYQIYPRSFADSNADGIGDLPGIIARLDYLQQLGVNAIWLSPHFPSPQVDCGYDIADYTAVDPQYGTLEDFKRMLAGMHARGMALILDLVLNHTSDQHAWFQQSRSSRLNPKRDWYIWREGKNGGPPNNWCSTFGGSAWELDPATGQYYYHYFFKEQPDLNWRNPGVKQAMFEAARFWLDLGVDGFRLDAIGTLFEDPALPDHTSQLTLEELYRLSRTVQDEADRLNYHAAFDAIFHYQYDQPGVHELLKELRLVVDEYTERILVGETDRIEYHGDGQDELHLVFNFPLLHTSRFTPAGVRANQQERLAVLPEGAWPCNTLANHDRPRLYNQFGDSLHAREMARMHTTLLLTLQGTVFLYYGDEIGMTDFFLTSLDQFRDTLGTWAYRTEISALGSTPEQALAYAARATRDRARTPMQWANRPNAGFSAEGAETWLPVNPDYQAGVNVEDQDGDENSLLNFYRHLLALRQAHPAFVLGSYTPLQVDSSDCLAFLRSDPQGSETCLVVLNMSVDAQSVSIPGPAVAGETLFTTSARPERLDLQQIAMEPFGVLIALLPG